MSDFGETRIHSHVFVQNETFFSWISLTSWLFILIFRADSKKKKDSMSFLTKNQNPARKIEFVIFLIINKSIVGGIWGGPQPPRIVVLDDC